MKWFLIGSVCLFCSLTWVRGDAAGDLYNKGIAQLQNEQYDDAAATFDQIVTGYPNTPNIDEVRLRAGYAYLHAGKFTEAVDRLSKEVASTTKPAYRPTALYYTALAQFSNGQKLTDPKQAKAAFSQAVQTFTTLISLITTAPTPDNQVYLEQSYYFRALSEYEKDDFDDAEKDLLTLVQQPQFSASLSRPDYFLRLGSIYAVETAQAVTGKKGAAAIQALADKALDAYDQVSRDPNALVQANEANMSKAEMLFLLAQSDSSPAGYQKALDAYRLVRRKEDMIQIQQKRVDDMRAAMRTQLAGGGSLANDNSLLIAREEGRLEKLKTDQDPIIQALIRMAECYVAMKEPDEARTILHRLANAPLTPDQQKEVDFQTLYSYVLSGQIAQANKALDAYLAKHAGDPQASSISYQIAVKLMDRDDYNDALEQADRSVHDFPSGPYAAAAITLKTQALNKLGRNKEADEVANDFLAKNPTNPAANQIFLLKAENEVARKDYNAALADYQKVRDNTSAGPDLQAAADAGTIQTLSAMGRFSDVITAAQAFATKYPNNTSLPAVLTLAGVAMDQLHQQGAVAALQDVARRYPKSDVAPFALFYVVNIYQHANNIPAMIQAAADLRNAFPDAYTYLSQTADLVSTELIKEKKFDDAIALYQPLLNAPKPDVASAAQDKIASIWLAAAKGLGAYQSLQVPQRTEAEKRLSTGEQAYLTTLKTYPDEVSAVGDAFDGLVTAMKQRRSWGILKDADMEAYLTKLTADLATPDMQTRIELAKAGLVFIYKNGGTQYTAALDRFRKAVDANPGLRLTRQETDQYGDLLLWAKDYTTSQKIYNDLLNNADPNDALAQGDAYYGLGAVALATGNLPQAKEYFEKLKALPGGGLWQAHILDANYGIAFADEQSTAAADTNEAQQIYSQLINAPDANIVLKAKAMLGYGRILEKTGHGVAPVPGTSESAVHYYQEPHTLFGPATPEQSAEGLFDAGQAYGRAGDKVNAKAQYDTLLKNYAATDWAAKAQAAESQLGQ